VEAHPLADKRASYAGEAVRALRFAFENQLKHPAGGPIAPQRRSCARRIAKEGKAAMAARTAAYGRACYAWAIKRGSLTEKPFAALPLAPVEKRTRSDRRRIARHLAGDGRPQCVQRLSCARWS